jgi:hypothetical protein
MEFLVGKKTYIIGFLMFAQALITWLTGETTFAELLTHSTEILGGLGLITLRMGVAGDQ